jgi:hypothetical protein
MSHDARARSAHSVDTLSYTHKVRQPSMGSKTTPLPDTEVRATRAHGREEEGRRAELAHQTDNINTALSATHHSLSPNYTLSLSHQCASERVERLTVNNSARGRSHNLGHRCPHTHSPRAASHCLTLTRCAGSLHVRPGVHGVVGS